jgi:signal transduction histidine kinase
LLQVILERAGLQKIRCVSDPRKALKEFREFAPDLVLLDLAMPEVDGFSVLNQLKEAIPPDDFRPVVVITGDQSPEAKERALSSGATDFLGKPFLAKEIALRVNNVLQTRRLHLQLKAANAGLEETVHERTRDLIGAMKELHETQRQIIQQERLHALGTMASGVVHDFNNALAIILSLGELVILDCQRKVDKDLTVSRMKSILTAAQDAARMADRLTQFYRKAPSEAEVLLDLNAIIRQTVGLTEPRWKTQAMERGIKIDVHLELHDLPPIVGHSSELREVLTNLIFNAVDAMPEGGVLTFKTLVNESDVEVSIGDTGTGMPEEVRIRCLEPFFTTKGDRGSGLGLSMVSGIIQRHDGTMDIDTLPGLGTTFKLRFPRERQVQTRAPEPAAMKLDAPLHILVVDDQDLFRDIVVHILELDGHVVSRTSSTSEAIDLLKAQKFDLLISDHGMPGMNGEQLLVFAKHFRPELRTMLMTSFGNLEANTDINSADLIVGKPISMIKLRTAVSKVMKSDALPHTVQYVGRSREVQGLDGANGSNGRSRKEVPQN